MSDERERILIVEDDREIARIVSMNLRDQGMEPEWVEDGNTGLKEARRGGYGLIILDVMLPGLDGITVCSRLREEDPYTPVLMLTAKAEEIDRVMGLELGADDYMTKPFSMRELMARVKALLRRSHRSAEAGPGSSSADDIRRIGGIVVDFSKHKVMLDEQEIDLTVKEFELLSLFVRNPGRAYSRAELLNIVWEYRFEGYEHTVNTHINRLRNKIEVDPAHPVYLKTVWGLGYRFSEPGEFSA